MNITKYFLRGDALIEFIRKESGLPPLARTKEYQDYVREGAIRRAKSEGVKRLFRNKINYQTQNTL